MPLDFTDAIEEVTGDEDFTEWLKRHAPGLTDVVSKDLTAGDVHVQSAGGDGKKKKKPLPEPPVSVAYSEAEKHSFADCLRYVQQQGDDVEKLKLKHSIKLDASPAELKQLTDALKENPTLRSALQQALNVAVGKAGTNTIRVVRHGATHLNSNDTSVDRIRGWSDVPLSEEGEDEAKKLASKMAKDPPDHLVCSDLARAHETAKFIAAACDIPIDEVSSGFRPWNVGKFAGQSSKTAVPILCDYAINKPDKKVPEGESFNEFRSRFFKALSEAVDKYGDNLAVVTHHRGERLLAAWAAAGHPADGTIDGKEFTKKGEGTAGEESVEIPVDRLHAAAKATVTKWINADFDIGKIWQGNEPADKSFSFNVCKVDAEQQIFYGWAYVSEENGQVIVDKQDDYILPGDLVKAAEEFTLHGGNLGDMHQERNVGRVVASFVTSAELCKAFGLTIKNDRRGWILGFKVDDPQVWSKIRGGAQLELSIGGRGERVEDS